MLLANLVFFRSEKATGNGIDSQRGEKAGGNSSCLQTLRNVDAREIEISRRHRCRRFEDVLAAVVEVLRRGYLCARQIEIRQLVVYHVHACRIIDWQLRQ